MANGNIANPSGWNGPISATLRCGCSEE
jgi:hypothetical protein